MQMSFKIKPKETIGAGEVQLCQWDFEALVWAERTDRIKDVSVSPLICSLMSCSPFLSSLLLSRPVSLPLFSKSTVPSSCSSQSLQLLGRSIAKPEDPTSGCHRVLNAEPSLQIDRKAPHFERTHPPLWFLV